MKAKLISLIIISFLTITCFGQKHLIKADALHKAEKFKKAIRQYSKYLNKNTDNAIVFVSRARCYRKIGKYKKSLDDTAEGLFIDPRCKQALKEKGAVIAIQGRPWKAIEYFTTAIEIDSNYADAYCARGAAYFLQDKFEKALEDNMKAIEIDSQFETSYYNVGLSLKELLRYEEAIAYFNKALLMDTDNQLTFFERAESLYELGEYGLAETDYTNSITYNTKLDPWENTKNGWCYYGKGMSNLALENLTQACADFKEAMSYRVYEAEEEYLKLDCKEQPEAEVKIVVPEVPVVVKQEVEVHIFPNPIKTYSHITITNSKSSNVYSLEVMDLFGKSVLSVSHISDSHIFNRKDLLTGTYVFLIKENGEILKSEKVIIQ
ncbi:MAG: hypothetical protein COA97_02060 [Flavobacteriales bacterium]|nr:MAG: hypothetical protein COA97_02060 [Flavobacteriales bacterium]